MVTAGSWFWWLMTSGALVRVAVASTDKGTVPPPPVMMPVLD